MERTGQLTEMNCITQKWLYQCISYPTSSSYSIVLTFLHQEVSPFCPFHGKNFINASINRIQ